MKVIIAGGGIGGLTAALSLHKVGIDVTCTRRRAARTAGRGNQYPATRVARMTELGLEHEVDRFGIRTTAMNYYTSSGVLAISQPCGLHADIMAPMVCPPWQVADDVVESVQGTCWL